MLRRNLRLMNTHIIQGASLLHDVAAVPILRNLLEEESDPDRRLTIAGALWKLSGDPVFIECLNQARTSRCNLLEGAHLLKVLWLGDGRAIDFLIDLLDFQEWLVRSQALGLLNELEFGRRMGIPAREMPRQPDDYRKRRRDPAFRELMTAAVRKWNFEMKTGR